MSTIEDKITILLYHPGFLRIVSENASIIKKEDAVARSGKKKE